jgi:hypothetical protein
MQKRHLPFRVSLRDALRQLQDLFVAIHQVGLGGDRLHQLILQLGDRFLLLFSFRLSGSGFVPLLFRSFSGFVFCEKVKGQTAEFFPVHLEVDKSCSVEEIFVFKIILFNFFNYIRLIKKFLLA